MTNKKRHMKNQCTSDLVMVRPARFDYNPQTAVNNVFQREADSEDVNEKARVEFDGFVGMLRSNGLDVLVIDDSVEPHKPDSVFPNNWISMHSNGTICLYPMFAPNRRLERDPSIIARISDRFKVRKIFDLSHFEKQGMYLEGTGSMVLDRENRIAYACLSERTNEQVLHEFCRKMTYRTMAFHAVDEQGKPIYHTNVVMCVAKTFAVACLDSVPDLKEREALRSSLESTGKEVVPITMAQLHSFAGNMLQVTDEKGRDLLVMSSRAHASLTDEQLKRIESHCGILHSPLDTIETHGGGSARCMIAENFLPERPMWFHL